MLASMRSSLTAHHAIQLAYHTHSRTQTSLARYRSTQVGSPCAFSTTSPLSAKPYTAPSNRLTRLSDLKRLPVGRQAVE